MIYVFYPSKIMGGAEYLMIRTANLLQKNGFSVGVIDSDYIGEIICPIVNHSQEAYEIKNGDRIAQMVVARHETVSWNVVDNLDETDRGSNGFGSSGVK